MNAAPVIYEWRCSSAMAQGDELCAPSDKDVMSNGDGWDEGSADTAPSRHSPAVHRKVRHVAPRNSYWQNRMSAIVGRRSTLGSRLSMLPGFSSSTSNHELQRKVGLGTEPFAEYERLKLLGQGTYGSAWLLRSPTTGILVVGKEVPVDGPGSAGRTLSATVENEVMLPPPSPACTQHSAPSPDALWLPQCAGAWRAIRHRRKLAVRTCITPTSQVRILSALNHPSVVAYYGAFRPSEGRLTIVMEHCDGGSLGDALDECVELGFHLARLTALRWARQLSEALAHLHQKRVLHRDLKTTNVFLSSPDASRLPGGAAGGLAGGWQEMRVVKLGDFGVSRALSHWTILAETVCGTPYYMAPELMCGQAYETSADNWCAYGTRL
jgi:serine/threonine protein kinase